MAAESFQHDGLLIPDAPIWRLSVAQYHQMIQSGILTEDDPVELLEGWLVTKMPKSRRHSLVTQLTREAIANVLPDGWFVDAQEPITTETSEPEPDVVVVRGTRRDYLDHHPTPDTVALVVEVSDATLQRDRTVKMLLYATQAFPSTGLSTCPINRLRFMLNQMVRPIIRNRYTKAVLQFASDR